MTAHVDPNAAHAVFAPSGAPTWTICTAQPEAMAALRRVVPEEENEAAEAGTVGHDELERRIGTLTGEPLDPATMPILPPNEDHPAAFGVALFVDFVRKLPPGHMWVEQRVILTPDIWGRADFVHFDPVTQVVTVVDYKNGFVGVDPDSEQLQIYAGAAIHTFGLKAKWVRLVIVQPNDFRPGVPRVKQWPDKPEQWADATAEKLLDRCAKWAAIPGGPKSFIGVGEHCRDCALFGVCEPSKDILAHFGTMVAKGVEGVPAEMIAKFTACKKPIDHFFEAMARRGTKLATAGQVPPGMVLVTAVKHRSWKNEAEAKQTILHQRGASKVPNQYHESLALGHYEAVPSEVVGHYFLNGVDALDPPTPVQAEKLGIDVSALVAKEQGGPVLAMEGDKRKPWAPKSAAEMFAGVAATVAKGEAGK